MEIINYKPVGKGALLAKFDVKISQWSLTIRDCSLLQKKDGDGKWIALPSRQYDAKDGTKKNYGLVFFEKEMNQRFQNKCLQLIQEGKFEQKAAPNNSVDVPF